MAGGGGIASLISASHNILPISPTPPQPVSLEHRLTVPSSMPISSLTPSTLANPPVSTNLSKTAVVISGERGAGLGNFNDGGMPNGLMANLWGSQNWGYVNRLEKDDPVAQLEQKSTSTSQSTLDVPTLPLHRKTASLGTEPQAVRQSTEEYPTYYPVSLKAQDAQFRMLFPTVPREEKVVLVFRAVWNPTDQQEFPGRVYVTTKEIYFYSNHLGLVLITGINMASIDDVTAAPGRDCDFLYVHFKDSAVRKSNTRLTIKVFLEPLKLLSRRLSYLVQNANMEEKAPLEEVIRALIKLEDDDSPDSPTDSWEDVDVNTPVDGSANARSGKDLKTTIRVDGDLFKRPGTTTNKPAAKFKLPPSAINYEPKNMTRRAVDREFGISAKALFHILFGDKSALSQILYRDRIDSVVTQSPWIQAESGLSRRTYAYQIKSKSGKPVNISDYQLIEVFNDHLCYEVMDKKIPWYLPRSDKFFLVSRIVISHSAKSKCRLAIYTKIDWQQRPLIGKAVTERYALKDMEIWAQDLEGIVAEQVAKLGSNSRTKKAIQIYGNIGQSTEATQVDLSKIPVSYKRKSTLIRRTLPGMMLKSTFGLMFAHFLTVLGWFVALLGYGARVFTAHTILILLLVASSSFNFSYTSQIAATWWMERSVNSFMKGLGVGPNTVMSRAVHLRDLDTFMDGPSILNNSSTNKW